MIGGTLFGRTRSSQNRVLLLHAIVERKADCGGQHPMIKRGHDTYAELCPLRVRSAGRIRLATNMQPRCIGQPGEVTLKLSSCFWSTRWVFFLSRLCAFLVAVLRRAGLLVVWKPVRLHKMNVFLRRLRRVLGRNQPMSSMVAARSP